MLLLPGEVKDKVIKNDSFQELKQACVHGKQWYS